MRRFARRAGLCAGGLAALYLLTGIGLALVPAPKLTHSPAHETAKGRLSPSAPACRESAEIRCFAVRDGFRLAARRTPPSLAENPPATLHERDNRGGGPATQSGQTGGAPIVLLLHGVLSSGAELEETARQLRDATGAEVLRLDLRGHGLSAASPWARNGVADVAHIGQYEEDVADVLSTLRRENPQARIVLAGHSMGGGIALRYALRESHTSHAGDVDGYLLFAPHLGERSPTSHPSPSGSPQTEGDSIVKVDVPRILGLAMLNAVRIRALNGLETLFFDLPFDLPVKGYTFRAMASIAPDDYRAALRADAKPMLVLVGENDEAFAARAYPKAIALHRNARTVLIPGESHDGVCRSAEALAAARDWLAEWKWRKGA